LSSSSDLGKYGKSEGICIDCPKGWYSDSKAAEECTKCKLGELDNGATQSCSACDVGKYGSSEGECETCPSGYFQDTKGLPSCQECPVDTYLSKEGKSSKADCEKCSEKKSTGVNTGSTEETSCRCKRTEFFTDESKNCVPCETGADCSAKDGLTLAELTAKPGYWRPSLDSKVFSSCAVGYSVLEAQNLANARCCPVDPITNISICARNMNNVSTSSSTNTLHFALDDQCAEGFSGPLCLVCADGFVKQGDGCTECPQGASIAIAMLPLIGMLVSLLVGLLLAFMCGKTATKAKDSGAKWFGQAKIILSFLQIFSSMPGVMDGVPWPTPFLQFALPLGLANLDFLAVLAETGCGLNVRFYDKFILHMILPVGCLIVIVLAYMIAKCCCIKKGDFEKEKQVKEIASKATILIILCLYPGLST